jgi:hypothetical protein
VSDSGLTVAVEPPEQGLEVSISLSRTLLGDRVDTGGGEERGDAGGEEQLARVHGWSIQRPVSVP